MIASLDESQKAFCEADINANIRLLAPAGCGKTMSLMFRCLHITKTVRESNPKYKPRFLLITFTVAARNEILSRLNTDARFADIRDLVEVITLNAWGYRRIKNVASNPKLISSKDDYHFNMANVLQPIWKQHPSIEAAIKARSNTTPRRLMDQLNVFKSIGFDHIRQTNYDLFAARYDQIKAEGLGAILDATVDELTRLKVLQSVTTAAGEEHSKNSKKDLYNSFFRFWRDAVKHLIDSAVFTLEDQKYFAYLDEREKVEAGSYLSGAAKYDYILVDEFQDINPLDLALLKAIKDRNRAAITIVGDDDQAIFEWRGATPEYILNPSQYFGVNFQTFTLSVNYRSPSNIVSLSQNLIKRNLRREDKSIRAYRSDIATIEILEMDDLDASMQRVYDEVQNAIKDGISPAKVAIISRRKAQLIPYQVFFAGKDIPFCAAEDLQIFMSRSFDRLLNLILIKHRATSSRTKTEVVDDVLALCDLVKRYPLSKSDKKEMRTYLNTSTERTTLGLSQFLEFYTGNCKGKNPKRKTSIEISTAILSFLNANTVSDSLFKIEENFVGLQADFGNRGGDDIFQLDPPFLHLADYATRYADDYMAFYEDIERAKDKLAYTTPFEEDLTAPLADQPIHLMTATRAKGKEFNTVILLDVNDRIWPHLNATTPDKKESERRLFYVAFTRAKQKIIMLVSKKIAGKPYTVSPFISELYDEVTD